MSGVNTCNPQQDLIHRSNENIVYFDMASNTSRVVLTLACATTAGIVAYVHFKQQSDREKMHEGVIKDVERQQRRKIENIYMIEKQNELAKQLRRDLSSATN